MAQLGRWSYVWTARLGHEPIHLDGLAAGADTSGQLNLAAGADRSGWLDMATRTDTFGQLDLAAGAAVADMSGRLDLAT